MKNIIKALAAAQTEFPQIKKESVNPHFKKKYCDYETLLGAVQPVLAKHGIIIVHGMVSEGGNAAMITRLVHIESGEDLFSSFPMAIDGNPQHTGSAVTYGKRYNLEALTAVAATDDDDGNAASPAPTQAYTPKSPPAAPQKPATSQPEAKKGGSSGWQSVQVPIGKHKGKCLGELANSSIQWFHKEYKVGLRKDGTPWPDSQAFRDALDAWHEELEEGRGGDTEPDDYPDDF